MRTLSEIRREIRALRRKYHREIAIYRMRRVAEEVHYDYARAVADRREPPKPLEIVHRIVDQGFRLTTWMNLIKYLERVGEAGDIPDPRSMLTNLLPWVWESKYDRLLMRELPPPEPKTDTGPVVPPRCGSIPTESAPQSILKERPVKPVPLGPLVRRHLMNIAGSTTLPSPPGRGARGEGWRPTRHSGLDTESRARGEKSAFGGLTAPSGPKRPKTAQNGPGKAETQIGNFAVPAHNSARWTALDYRFQIRNGPKWSKMARNSKKSRLWVKKAVISLCGFQQPELGHYYWPGTHARLIMAPSSERSVEYVPGTQSL